MKNIQLIGSLLASSILVGCGGDSGGSDAGPVSHAPVINSITATEEYFIDDVIQLTVVVTDEDTPLEELSITYSTGSSEVLVTDKDQEVTVTVADDEHQTVDTITIPAGVKNGNLNPIRSPYDHVETKVALFNAIAEQTGSDIVIETNENGDYFVIVDEETYILSDLTEEEVYELIDIINDGFEGAPNVRPIDGSPVTVPTITAITLDGGTTLGAQVFVVVDAHDEDGDDLTVTYNTETSNEFAVGREDQLVKVDVTDGTYLVSQSIVIPKAQDDVLLPEPIEGEPSPLAPVIESTTQSGGIYVGDKVTLSLVVTDEDTPLEDITVTYSTPTGTNELVRIDSDQVVTVSVLDGTYLIKQDITVVAGEPPACEEGEVCLPVGDIPEPHDRLIDPIEGSPVTAPVIHSVTLDGGIYLNDVVKVIVDAADEDGSELTITYNEQTSNVFAVGREAQVIDIEVTDGTYLVSQSITIPKAVDDEFIPTPIDPTPAPIAPVIESATQSGGIYVDDKVTLSVVVTDEDTPLEDIKVTYSTPTGTGELARTDSDQVVTVSVLDGTYLIKQDITVVVGQPLACEEGEVCLPVDDIPEPHDRLIDPIEGTPVTAPVIHSVTLDGGIYLNDVVKVIVDATDEDGSELTITYNEQASNVFAVGREAHVIDVEVTDGTYLVGQSITIPKAVDDEFIPTPIDPTPAPIAPVIESITQSGGIYVGDKVTLSIVVTDEDTPLEDITVTYTTPTGTGELARTNSDQVVTVSVLDGTYLIKQDITVVAGEPLPNKSPKIIKISAPDYVYAMVLATIKAEANDADGDPLLYSWVQTNGPKVEIVDNTNTLTFIAPEVSELTYLEFLLTVRDDKDGLAQEAIGLDLWVDTDGDGIPNHIDNDDDNDGVVDSDDLDPLDPLKKCVSGKAPSQDGYCSLDVDNDGIADEDQTIEVNNYLELKEALKQAVNNEQSDFINLNSGTYNLENTLIVISDKNYGLYISGNSSADTIVDGHGNQIISFNYMVPSDNFVSIEISNITFKNGVVKKSTSNQVHPGYGGAIYAGVGTNLTVKDSVFYNNSAEVNGGAVYANAFFTSINNNFESNVAGNDGGGVWANYNTSVKDTSFVSNEAVRGGGFYNYQSWTPSGYESSLIEKSLFTKNIATNSGGGLYMNSGGSKHPVLISDSEFIGNSAVSGNYSGIGGGFYANVFYLSDSIIESNIVDGRGAGFSSYHGSSESNVSRSIIKNNINSNIDDSSTLDCGGGFYIRYGSVDNSIITSNMAKNGGSFCAQYGIELINSIVKDNSSGISIDSHSSENPVVMVNNVIIDNVGYEIYDMDTNYGSPMLYLKNNFVDTSDIPLLFMDENNIFQGVNPSFFDTDDYHLKSDSHLIDAGCESCVNDDRDLDNETRVYGNSIDIGPYEYRP